MAQLITTAASVVAAVCNIVLMVRLLIENMKKRTKFHIKADGTSLKEVLEAIEVIKTSCPNSEIDVEAEV